MVHSDGGDRRTCDDTLVALSLSCRPEVSGRDRGLFLVCYSVSASFYLLWIVSFARSLTLTCMQRSDLRTLFLFNCTLEINVSTSDSRYLVAIGDRADQARSRIQD